MSIEVPPILWNQRPHARQVTLASVMADEHHVVEADRFNALQALSRFGWRTLERDRAGVRRRTALQVRVDVRQYRALAAVRPEGLHAGFQIFPCAVEA